MTVEEAFNQARQELSIKFDNVLNVAADMAIAKFKENIDAADSKYKPSIFSPTLIKSGKLKNSFYKEKINSTTVSIKNPMLYGLVQNGGMKIAITDKMIKFFWAKFYETGRIEYKNMALTKKTHIEIPMRDFMTIDENEIFNIIYSKL